MDSPTEYLWCHPPACIAAFRLKALRSGTHDGPPTKFGLACECGSERGSVVGFRLRSLRTDYSGPETLVSPLAFVCSSCSKTTEIIDTDVHGYHGALQRYCGESSKPATIRGSGPREAFECPTCNSTEMRVVVTFYYSGAEQDIEEDDETGHMEDFFVGFNAQGSCSQCGAIAPFAEFVHL